MTRVLFSSTSYPRSQTDWQGIFIRRMADSLAAREDIQLRVWAPPGPLHPNANYVCNERDIRFLSRLAEKGGIAHLLRSTPPRGVWYAAELLVRLHNAFRRNRTWTDVCHANWLQCALGQVGLANPIVATVLGSDLALLDRPGISAALRLTFRNRNVVLCPNAPWMIEPLRRHFGDNCPKVVCVPFGIDDVWFNVERNPSQGRNVWIIVLRVTRAKLGPLFEWTKDLDPNRHEFHLFGPRQEAIEAPPWINYHGAATPEQLATQWFPIATGMISLSHHAEGRPQVMLEAMAAGLPLVASRIAAHEDVMQGGDFGLLVSDKEQFYSALSELADPDTNRAIACRARDHARITYGNWAKCAERFAHIYQTISASS
jgi:glycosyltransferase involved in cell wall biosynthesis